MADLDSALRDTLVHLVETDPAVRAALVDALAAGDSDGYLDVQGAALFLSCDTNRIYKLVHSGLIPHEREGRRLLFDRTQLRQWVKDGGGSLPGPQAITSKDAA